MNHDKNSIFYLFYRGVKSFFFAKLRKRLIMNIFEKNINKVEKDNVLEKPSIENGETLIVMQRHQEYVKDRNSADHGSLTTRGREDAVVDSAEKLNTIIEGVNPKERQNLFFLILSSDSTYPGVKARAMESSIIFSEALLKIMEKYGISENNFLNHSRKYRNTKHNEPRPTHNLRISPDIDKSSPFGKYLAELYPENPDFIQAFDRDKEKKKRIEMKAEGPEETAKRMKHFLIILKRYAKAFHGSNPGSRLVIFNFTHYDTISPLVKKEITKESISERYLPVDFGGGVSIIIDKNGKMQTRINGVDYELTKK